MLARCFHAPDCFATIFALFTRTPNTRSSAHVIHILWHHMTADLPKADHAMRNHRHRGWCIMSGTLQTRQLPNEDQKDPSTELMSSERITSASVITAPGDTQDDACLPGGVTRPGSYPAASCNSGLVSTRPGRGPHPADDKSDNPRVDTCQPLEQRSSGSCSERHHSSSSRPDAARPAALPHSGGQPPQRRSRQQQPCRATAAANSDRPPWNDSWWMTAGDDAGGSWADGSWHRLRDPAVGKDGTGSNGKRGNMGSVKAADGSKVAGRRPKGVIVIPNADLSTGTARQTKQQQQQQRAWACWVGDGSGEPAGRKEAAAKPAASETRRTASPNKRPQLPPKQHQQPRSPQTAHKPQMKQGQQRKTNSPLLRRSQPAAGGTCAVRSSSVVPRADATAAAAAHGQLAPVLAVAASSVASSSLLGSSRASSNGRRICNASQGSSTKGASSQGGNGNADGGEGGGARGRSGSSGSSSTEGGDDDADGGKCASSGTHGSGSGSDSGVLLGGASEGFSWGSRGSDDGGRSRGSSGGTGSGQGNGGRRGGRSGAESGAEGGGDWVPSIHQQQPCGIDVITSTGAAPISRSQSGILCPEWTLPVMLGPFPSLPSSLDLNFKRNLDSQPSEALDCFSRPPSFTRPTMTKAVVAMTSSGGGVMGAEDDAGGGGASVGSGDGDYVMHLDYVRGWLPLSLGPAEDE